MSDRSAIEWTDATWNPVRGCTKISSGCAHCYAETFAERFRGVPGHPYEHGFDLRLVPDKLDLILSNVYVLPFRDVGPEGMTAEDRAHASYEHYSKRFEAALGLRYLAVVRTLSYVKPVATSETAFEGGTAKFEVFLLDTQDKTVKASFPVEARSKPSVEYVYQEGKDDKKERLAAFARSTLWEDAREKIAEGLRTHAGATVVFD